MRLKIVPIICGKMWEKMTCTHKVKLNEPYFLIILSNNKKSSWIKICKSCWDKGCYLETNFEIGDKVTWMLP